MTNVINFPTKENFVVIASDATTDDTIFATNEVCRQKFASVNDAISAFKTLEKSHDEVELYTIDYDLIESTHDFNNFEDAKNF